MELARLPFTITEIFAGFAKAHGILIVTPEHLLFEYQMTDALVGAISGKTVKRPVAYKDIAEVEAKPGFFSPRLVFTAKHLGTFTDFPHKDPTTLQIRIPWKKRKLIKPTLSEIELHRSFVEADRYRDNLESA